MDREELIEIMEEIFDRRSRMSPEIHFKQHQWLEAKMEKDLKLAKLFDSLAKTLLQWSVVGIATALTTRLITGHWPSL